MTTLDLIQSKLSDLDEPTLKQIYAIIQQLSPTVSPTVSSNPGLLSQLRQIQIDTSEQSALAAAGDLVGCVEGPSDLSTNKAYMAGFGQS